MESYRKNNRIKYREISKFSIGVIVVLAIAFVSETTIPRQAILQKLLWVLFAGFGSLIVLYNNRSYKNNGYIYIMGLFAIPFLIGSFYTILRCAIVEDTLGIAKQSITTTLFIIVDILMIQALVEVFKSKEINVMAAGIIVCYLLTLLRGIKSVGVGGLISSYLSGNEALFERHDVGTATVPILLYFFYKIIFKNDKMNKGQIITLVSLILITVLCGKRSAYLSLGVGVIILFLYKILKKNSVMLAQIIAIITVVGCFIFVVGIRSGIFNFLLQTSGTLRDRYYVWKWFDSVYTVSPLYLGQGFQFVHKYMEAGLGDGMVNSYVYLHNSILQIFIETGLWGFFMWLGTYFFVIPQVSKRRCGNGMYLFVVMSMVAMIAMFTLDNTLTYPLYQVSLYSSIYAVYCEERNCKNAQS